MMKRVFAAAIVCATLAGCATSPTQQTDGVSLAAVEERVKCEIGQAYRTLEADNNMPDLSRWAAGLTLSLAVDETGSVTPSTSLVGPYGRISPLDLSAGLTANAKRTGLVNIYVAFLEAASHRCEYTGFPPIEGRLGLSDWIVRVFRAQYDVALRSKELSANLRSSDFNPKDKSIGYTLEFVLTLNASATPNFVITNAATKSVFSAESKSTHAIDIAMVEMSEADFKTHFEEVKIPIKKRNDAETDFLPSGKLKPKFIYRKKATGTDVSLGFETKIKINDVLQQLNTRSLIQSLRR